MAVAHPKLISLESQSGPRAPYKLCPPSIPISPTPAIPAAPSHRDAAVAPVAPGVSLNLDYPSSHWH
eukprot:1114516-Rhodomonas_salina.1